MDVLQASAAAHNSRLTVRPVPESEPTHALRGDQGLVYDAVFRHGRVHFRDELGFRYVMALDAFGARYEALTVREASDV